MSFDETDAHHVGNEGTETHEEPTWTYRGYQMEGRDFVLAMSHFYRSEVVRANTWRVRLDTTTNWAVIATSAAITIAFSEPSTHHSLILLDMTLVTLFLFIEARRYRTYELWSYRARLMETDFFSTMLVPPFRPSADWSETLAETLLHPRLPISVWEAMGRRLRRNYLWIYLVLNAAWLVKVSLSPVAVSSFEEMLAASSIGIIPGWFILISLVLVDLFFIAVSYFTLRLHDATGEVLPFERERTSQAHSAFPQLNPVRDAWFRPRDRHRPQILALIITDQAEAVSRRLLEEMHRGVTAMDSMGMYRKEHHTTLMCALTETEVHRFKRIVKQEDPDAMLILTHADEILGKGFQSFE